jgi:hypothetical protein
MSNFRRIGEPFKVLGGINGQLGGARPGGGVAVTPFVPTDVPGLVLWLDASDISTLFQDVLYTVPVVADGNSIAGFQDKSGNVNHMTQAVVANRPTYKVGIQNALPIVRFDGTNDYLARGNAISSAVRGSVIAVHILRALEGQDTVFCISVAGTGNQFSLFMPYYTAVFPHLSIRMRNILDDRTVVGNSGHAINMPYLDEWHSNGATYRFFCNGNDEVENPLVGANDGAWFSIIAGANQTSIGARVSGGLFNYIQMDLCELLVYDGDILAYYESIRNYLNDKWAVY